VIFEQLSSDNCIQTEVSPGQKEHQRLAYHKNREWETPMTSTSSQGSSTGRFVIYLLFTLAIGFLGGALVFAKPASVVDQANNTDEVASQKVAALEKTLDPVPTPSANLPASSPPAPESAAPSDSNDQEHPASLVAAWGTVVADEELRPMKAIVALYPGGKLIELRYKQRDEDLGGGTVVRGEWWVQYEDASSSSEYQLCINWKGRTEPMCGAFRIMRSAGQRTLSWQDATWKAFPLPPYREPTK
jgi:hypothetical protein